MKDYLVLYKPDHTYGLQLYSECDNVDQAIDEWKRAMMTSPVEEPIIAKLVRLSIYSK